MVTPEQPTQTHITLSAVKKTMCEVRARANPFQFFENVSDVIVLIPITGYNQSVIKRVLPQVSAHN